MFLIMLNTEVYGVEIMDVKPIGYMVDETEAKEYCRTETTKLHKYNNLAQYYTYAPLKNIGADTTENINIKNMDLDQLFEINEKMCTGKVIKPSRGNKLSGCNDSRARE